MEPLLEKISITLKNSFAIKEDILPYISTPWHFHPEFELTLITKSKGKRFVGDHVEYFYPGDMIFVGPHLPHFHRNAEEYYQDNEKLKVRAVVIHFLKDFLGKEFFERPELIKINHLFAKSIRGLKVYGKTKELVSQKMEKILLLNGFDRLLQLLEILNILSNSKEITPLSSPAFQYPVDSSDVERVNTVYQYILVNYRNNIKLKEVAFLLNMSNSTFCRFFKKRTGRTFSEMINELRVGHSCRLLMESELTVTQLCYESGFNNFSYFQRQFKKITKTTPLKYKQEFLEKEW